MTTTIMITITATTSPATTPAIVAPLLPDERSGCTRVGDDTGKRQ